VGYSEHMTKEQLIDITKRLLETDAGLEFLTKLSKTELETLVAAIRNQVKISENPEHRRIILNASSC